MEKRLIKLQINGASRKVYIEPKELLIDVLRENLGLTGTKYGCGIGECGACTVLLDGEPILGCLTFAMAAQSREIVTIEGISDGRVLEPVQEAFLEHGAVQCGFCTPGMIVKSAQFVKGKERVSEEEIKEYLRGNICRCTGYVNIIRAIKAVVEE